MSAWRHQAFERFPELRALLQEAENPYAYWIELQHAFHTAFWKGDIDLFLRILEYADWSFDQPQGKTLEDDLMTCIHFCFLEHISGIAPSITENKDGRLQEVPEGKLVNDPDVNRLYADLLSRASIDRRL